MYISRVKKAGRCDLTRTAVRRAKKYTVEVTEFTLPLGAEGPLEPLVTYQTYDFMALLEVRRKVAGIYPGADGTRLRDVANIGPTLRNFEFFRPTTNNAM